MYLKNVLFFLNPLLNASDFFKRLNNISYFYVIIKCHKKENIIIFNISKEIAY